MVYILTNSAIEQIANSAVKDLANRHPLLDPTINDHDKNITYDGTISGYIKGGQNFSKDYWDFTVPIQIKGHRDNKNERSSNSICRDVQLSDLRIYNSERGAMYFVVLMDEDGGNEEIFFAPLTALKAKEYLEKAVKKKSKKTIRVKFTKIQKTPDELYSILKKFVVESKIYTTHSRYDIESLAFLEDEQALQENSFGDSKEDIVVTDNSWEKVEELYNIQSLDILKHYAMPWDTNNSIDYEYVMSSLLMPGRLTQIKSAGENLFIDDYINNHSMTNNIAIIGTPGIGKSTILGRIYLKRILVDKDILHIFTDARDYSDFSFKTDELLPYLMSIIGIEVPLKMFSGFRILIDGFDEVDTTTQDIIFRIIKKYRKPYVFIVACRLREYQEKIESNIGRYMLFENVFCVNEWETEVSNEYARKVLTRNGLEKERVDLFIETFSNQDDFSVVYSTPLYLNILLYLFFSGEYSINSLHDSNLYLLYDRFISTLHKNERKKGVPTCAYVEFIETSISIAKGIFCIAEDDSHSPLKKQQGFVYNDLFKELRTSHIDEQSIFSTILIIDQDEDIIRFRHETFYEYFLAKSFLLSLQYQDLRQVIEEFGYFYDFYINKFVRAGISTYKENSEHYYNVMCSIYYMCIRKIPDLIEKYNEFVDDFILIENANHFDDIIVENEITIRELSVYYCGRLVLSNVPKLLRFVWENDPSLLIRRTAILGLLLNNDEEAERQYLQELVPGSEHDIMQRSLSLLYFGDAKGSILSYQDDCIVPWKNVRKEIMERLKYNDERNLLFRFWDLRTITLFCESRKSYKFTKEEFDIINKCTVESDLFSESKTKAIIDEKNRLVQRILQA